MCETRGEKCGFWGKMFHDVGIWGKIKKIQQGAG
jgi:hypothetical protein